MKLFYKYLCAVFIYTSAAIAQQPTADFTASPRSGGSPLSVQFTDLSIPGSSEIVDWQWEFGDGGIIVGQQNPSYIYEQAGTFSVTLTIRDSDNVTDAEIKVGYISVTGPVAHFNGEPLGGLRDLSVNFTDLSTPGPGATITSRLWDFGDGITSSSINPNHTYATGGINYTVSLTVTNNNGQSSTIVKNEYVKVVEPGFMAEPLDERKNLVEGAPPLTVTFIDTSRPDSGPIQSWLWDFGDGNSSSEQNPVYTYADTGIYTVSLTMFDTLGNQATVSRQNYIQVINQPVYSSAIPTTQYRSAGNPVSVTINADVSQHPRMLGSFSGTFTWDPAVLDYVSHTQMNSAFAGNVNTNEAASGFISFNGISITGVDGLFDLFTVDLLVIGEENTSSDLELAYATFESNLVIPGSFITDLRPFLIINNSTFTVVRKPQAQFSALPLRGYDPLDVSFTDETIPGTGTINSYQWDFGDGNTSLLQNPSHRYMFDLNFPQPADTFDITLIVSDIYGERDTLIKHDYIITDRSFRQVIKRNWNIVALPVIPDDPSFSANYPHATSSLFGWNGSVYEVKNELTFKNGYWMEYPVADTLKIKGFPDYGFLDTLQSGWNLIAGPSGDLAVTDIDDINQVILAGTWYGWEDGIYRQVDTLKPGRGYWVQATDSSLINVFTEDRSYFEKKSNIFDFDLSPFPSIEFVSAGGSSRKLYFNVVIDSPYSKHNFSLPPLPPKGGFDVRFTDGSRISQKDRDEIAIQADAYPVTISIPFQENKHLKYKITQKVSGRVIDEDQVETNSTLEIRNRQVNHLQITLVSADDSRQIPLRFHVKQNYPNPFNPETRIPIAIPAGGQVSIIVYNALGQKVKEWASAYMDAGYYEVGWDGKNDLNQEITSGIYYCLVNYSGQIRSFKMLLLK